MKDSSLASAWPAQRLRLCGPLRSSAPSAVEKIYVHFGWPLSSWLDRIATRVFVANLMRLPRMFPRMHHSVEYPSGRRIPTPEPPAAV